SVEIGGEERVVVVQEVAAGRDGVDLSAVVESIRESVTLNHDLQVYAVVLIEPGSIPKTSSGKIRRRACRHAFLEGSLEVVELSRLADTASTPAPDISRELVVSTPAEERKALVKLYLEHCVRRLFRLIESEVPCDESLSKLGLDSLVAFELSTEIATKLGVEITPADLLAGPSIVELADQILVALGKEDTLDSSLSIESVRREDSIPLSSTQLRLWFLDQMVQG